MTEPWRARLEPNMTPIEIEAWVALAQDGTLSRYVGTTTEQRDVRWLSALSQRVERIRSARRREHA